MIGTFEDKIMQGGSFRIVVVVHRMDQHRNVSDSLGVIVHCHRSKVGHPYVDVHEIGGGASGHEIEGSERQGHIFVNRHGSRIFHIGIHEVLRRCPLIPIYSGSVADGSVDDHGCSRLSGKIGSCIYHRGSVQGEYQAVGSCSGSTSAHSRYRDVHHYVTGHAR